MNENQPTTPEPTAANDTDSVQELVSGPPLSRR